MQLQESYRANIRLQRFYFYVKLIFWGVLNFFCLKCLNSLRKYPLPLYSGKECIILEGFGDKICQTIDKKLEDFLADGGNTKTLVLFVFLSKLFSLKR
jgi:hypothetical protein